MGSAADVPRAGLRVLLRHDDQPMSRTHRGTALWARSFARTAGPPTCPASAETIQTAWWQQCATVAAVVGDHVAARRRESRATACDRHCTARRQLG